MRPKDIEKIIREWIEKHPQAGVQFPLESPPDPRDGLMSITLFHPRPRRYVFEFDELFLLVLWGLDTARTEGDTLVLDGFNACLYDTGSGRSEAQWFRGGQVILHSPESKALKAR